MTIPWAEKYRPKTLGDFVGNKKAVKQLLDWLDSWTTDPPKKKAAFLYGPPGVGKTSVIEILAHKYDYDFIILDASNWRTKGALEKILGLASKQRPLFHSSRLFVLDELEGMSGTSDRGGIRAVTTLINKSNFPTILIANDIWNPKFSSLRNKCTAIQFRRVPTRSIAVYLRKISKSEELQIDEKTLTALAKRAHGDLRSAITDFQALSQGRASLEENDIYVLGERDRHEAVFNLLNRLFHAKTFWDARRIVQESDIAYDMLFEWIYENLPYHLSTTQDLCNALDALSRADIYFKRARTFQAWKLLKYAFDQMTAGVAGAKSAAGPSRWTPYKFPQRIRLLSRSRAQRRLRTEIAERMKPHIHLSISTITREVLPYLKLIFSKDPNSAKEIARDFDLHENLIDYLKTH
jgi:replication factor C large subunit